MNREQRKAQHIQLALKNDAENAQARDFDDLRLVHLSVPTTRLTDISLTTNVGNLSLASPIYLNAMTGGSRSTAPINRDLAIAAAAAGVAMGVGSQHAALVNDDVRESFQIVRQYNPYGVIFANVGASVSVEQAIRAVDMLEAQALQIHVNVPQELVMPEGDRDFTNILRNIEKIVTHSPVPVIVKEVGFGMVAETFLTLRDLGVQIVDVGGRGGTDFVWIENERRVGHEYGFLSGWGQSTAISLLESFKYQSELTILASGGIRHALDMLKCLALGARGVGVAGPALARLHEHGVDGLIEQLNAWNEQLKTLLTLIGVTCIADVARHPLVITGGLHTWCDARGIDVRVLAVQR